tara:strand:+ start:78 stop:1190 length:1113 start_codon:yes stop_codon:yes gene_type:complete
MNMMNEFGVPYNDAEISMMPGSPGKIHLERELAFSGAQGQQLLPVLVGAAAGLGLGAVTGGALAIGGATIGMGAILGTAGAAIGGQIAGGQKAARAAKDQAKHTNEATDRAHEYDVDLWNMQREKIIADRDYAVKVIQRKAENEGLVAAWKDATNSQRYNYELAINQKQQDSLDRQFAKSTDVFNRQITLNERSELLAVEDEYASLAEIEAEQRYSTNDAWVKFLENEGEMRARFESGRTAGKGGQVSYFELGQEVAAVNAALSGARENTFSRIQEISFDRQSADLAAEAARMLDPGQLPDIPIPIATPTSTFEYPRALGEYDFGPHPVKGVYMSPSAAANQVWGNTISGIAGTVGSIATGVVGGGQFKF